jgi:leader peptidase (prepilin peptidase) / N-methyltransferase
VLVSASMDPMIAGLFGLLIGSFLNVVIHRLPRMMERQWRAECAELCQTPLTPEDGQPLNLLRPASRCPHCGHLIAWHENIPVLSYLLLQGKCASCKTAIGLRYPLVEMACAALFYFCTARFGWTWPALAWAGFCATLLALAMIDWDTTLLPDDMTLPLLWAGLIAAALGLNPLVPSLSTSLWGGVAGYLSLWLVYWGFKLLTGKEGMGHGDFKLFAALGAWFGWPMLVPIILMSSGIGALVGIALKLNQRLRPGGYVPFGPFLAGAGFVILLAGPDRIARLIGG